MCPPSPVTPDSQITALLVSNRHLTGLRIGQSIRALVVDADDQGRATLLLRGLRVPVQTQNPLTAGQAIMARVENVGEQVVLKLEALKEARTGRKTSAESKLKGIVSSLLGDADSKDLAAANALRQSDVPLSRESLLAMRSVLFGREELPENFQEIKSIIVQLSEMERQFPRELGGLDLKELLALLEGAMLKMDKGDPAGLLEFIRGSGLFSEANLARMLEAGVPLHDILARLSKDLKWRLRQSLTRIQEILRGSADLDKGLASRLRALGAVIESVLERIQGQQLQNLRPSTDGYLYFELPLSRDDGFKEARVEIFHQRAGEEDKPDPDNACIALHLDMSRLGKVEALLTISSGVVGCRFVTTEESSMALSQNMDELKDALAGIGYVAGSFLAQVPDNRSDGADAPKPMHMPGVFEQEA